MSLRLIEGQPLGNTFEVLAKELQVGPKTAEELHGYAEGVLFRIPQLKDAATTKTLGMSTPPSFFSEQERDAEAVEFQKKDARSERVIHYLVRRTPDFLSVTSLQGPERNKLIIDLKSRIKQKGQQYTDAVTFEKYKMDEGILSEYVVKKGEEAIENGNEMFLSLIDHEKPDEPIKLYPYKERPLKNWTKRGLSQFMAAAATITLRPFH